MIDMKDEWAYTFTNDESILFQPIPVPDLRTGVGHGHFRPQNRELPERDRLQKTRKKRKIAKKSKGDGKAHPQPEPDDPRERRKDRTARGKPAGDVQPMQSDSRNAHRRHHVPHVRRTPRMRPPPQRREGEQRWTV